MRLDSSRSFAGWHRSPWSEMNRNGVPRSWGPRGQAFVRGVESLP
jgi:hypothetical protein